MSNSAKRARLESIDGVSLGAGTHERLQLVAIRHVNPIGKQVGEVLRNFHILEQADGRLRLKLDQDVDIAARLGLGTSDGAEQRRVQNATTAQLRLVGA